MSNKEEKPFPYHVLDETTPWCEFLAYLEICHQLGVKNQPTIGRFLKYHKFLKEAGIK